MPFPSRSYVVYVDDSGSEKVGWLWSGLALPLDLWTEYLGRWLSFRRWLYNQHAIPASFELHAQAWLAVEPVKQTAGDQLALAVQAPGGLPEILSRGKDERRSRFEVFEKGLKTIGTFTEARLFTTFTPSSTGEAKFALYDDLLCFVEDFLAAERGHATFLVDGGHDSGGHLRAAHRALLIKSRRVIEDAGLRRSSDSQLLQMADVCAHAAFQSIQDKPTLDVKFRRHYEKTLDRVIARPFGVAEGRCIRGHDYAADQTGCPSERAEP